MTRIEMILVAFVLDLIIGDPYSFPHPVKLPKASIATSTATIVFLNMISSFLITIQRLRSSLQKPCRIW